MSRTADLDTPPALACTYRDLRTIDECAAVVALEREIWGPDYDEAVPPAILKVTANRGGILVGAFEPDGQMAGFVYSLPSVVRGRRAQWSHKLGVAPRCRSGGLGQHLKLLQRERALRLGIDLIEWTFDPLNAINAHLNISKLGVVVDQYEPDFYGRTTVPIPFRSMLTDRVIATWMLRDPRVEARIAAYAVDGGRAWDAAVRSEATNDAVGVVSIARGPRWIECRDVVLDAAAPTLRVDIPLDYGEMSLHAAPCACMWRLQTREVFSTYFARGYRAVDFLVDRRQGTASYVLTTGDGGRFAA
jgi:predicted GNAT superfamily acetyltransferase